jgi:nitroreductase
MHEMAGFDRAKAREVFAVPEGWEPVAMIAIGYPGSPESLPESLRAKEISPRSRKPLGEFLFAGRFGTPLEI